MKVSGRRVVLLRSSKICRPVQVAVPVRLVAGIDARLRLRHELRIHGGCRDQGRAGLRQEYKALVERILQS